MAEMQFVIGELAKRTGYTPGMIRYFEKAEVISPSLRTPAGYRLFGTHHVEELQFVRVMQDLGFHARQIKLLRHIKSSNRPLPEKCEAIKKILKEHMNYVEKKMASQRALHERLQEAAPRFVDLVLENDTKSPDLVS